MKYVFPLSCLFSADMISLIQRGKQDFYRIWKSQHRVLIQFIDLTQRTSFIWTNWTWRAEIENNQFPALGRSNICQRVKNSSSGNSLLNILASTGLIPWSFSWHCQCWFRPADRLTFHALSLSLSVIITRV